MIERHHDHIFILPSLADGAVTPTLRIPMDSDAPFCVRALGGYSDNGTSVSALPNLLLLRFADASDNWLHTARTPGLLAQPGNTSFVPLRRHVTFPARSAMTFELENRSGAVLTNVVIILRGAKYFPGSVAAGSSAIYSPTYPECYAQETFQYTFNFSLTAGQTQLDIPLNVNSDADFAWRGSLMTLNPTVANAQIDGLGMRVRDANGKAYSSSGLDGGAGVFLRAGWLAQFDQSQFPALWYPELYMRKSHQFTVDLVNTNGGAPCAGQMALEGAKIFTR
jgi:hypothetical protein